MVMQEPRANLRLRPMTSWLTLNAASQTNG
jgi:hypothetical protein